MKCLENGIFAKTTVKPLSSVFDLSDEKKVVSMLVNAGEWFTVSGLRRTGKTTLVRSVANSLNVIPIYVNLWDIPVENVSLDSCFELIANSVRKVAENRSLRKVLKMVEKISFFGVSIDVKVKSQMSLTDAFRELCSKGKVVLIIDEVQELLRYSSAFKYLAALHDELAPSLSVVFLGSIASLKNVLERPESAPLYGRLSEEIVLKPFDETTSRRLLKAGFEECNVPFDDEIIEEASLRLGGFAGWLTHFGRICVLQHLRGEEVEFEKVLKHLEKEVIFTIYGEIARALTERRKITSYLRVLRFAAEMGEVSVSAASKLLGKAPSTAITYLKHLVNRGLLKKDGEVYRIADPMIRRAVLRSEFEKEVKVRIV